MRKQPKTLGEMTERMLAERMPASEDADGAIMEMGIKPTLAAHLVYGVIMKACKGDTSAAKFVREMNGEEDAPAETFTDLASLSDSLLLRLAGINITEAEKNG